MSAQLDTLHVYMNDLLVGKLVKQRSKSLQFTYAADWLAKASARPISLSLPLTSQTYHDDRVYHFFDNLLPDNYELRKRIQTRLQLPSADVFELLAAIGKDCIGALQLCHEPLLDEQAIRVDKLSHAKIADMLKHPENSPLGMTGKEEDFRISLAGMQEKIALLYYEKHWCRPLGKMPTSHIFKLPIGHINQQNIDLTDSCENEYLCLEIAKAFGISAANAEIKTFEKTKALVVERFDRQWSADHARLLRIPQEDMCQALGFSPNIKYEADGGPGIKAICKLLRDSKQRDDIEVFFKSQILFYLLAAIDGHAKNFSVFIEPGGHYRLTPLYDIISAHPLIANKQLQEQKIKMAMALIGDNKHYRWHNISARHFISTAEAVNYSPIRMQQLLDEMLAKVDSVISTVEKKLPKAFPSFISDPIFSGIYASAKKL